MIPSPNYLIPQVVDHWLRNTLPLSPSPSVVLIWPPPPPATPLWHHSASGRRSLSPAILCTISSKTWVWPHFPQYRINLQLLIRPSLRNGYNRKEQYREYLTTSGQHQVYDSLFWRQCPASLLTCAQEAEDGSLTAAFLHSLSLQGRVLPPDDFPTPGTYLRKALLLSQN